ncbi:MAG TPA: phosphoserine phosphatase [Thermoanaerobaculia bacterium]|nr:phosphoserine phosphatase [Thermoanaerobaculia bacterium]
MTAAGGYSRPFLGLTVCGDTFLVDDGGGGGGALIAAVVDGLGHGAESSHAAHRAVEVIREHRDLPVQAILMRCHQELQSTRGAALGLIKLREDGQGEFCGVGNIEVKGVVGRAPSVFCLAGIVGHRVRATRVMPFTMRAGDVYCMLSDGVSSRADLKSCLPGAPAAVARRIVERWGKAHDDATALVLGYQGGAALEEDSQLSPSGGSRP